MRQPYKGQDGRGGMNLKESWMGWTHRSGAGSEWFELVGSLAPPRPGQEKTSAGEGALLLMPTPCSDAEPLSSSARLRVALLCERH